MTDSSVALDLHRRSIVIDAVDVSVPSRERFLRMQAAGLTGISETLAIFENLRETVDAIVQWNDLLAENSDVVKPVRTASDIRAAKEEGRVGVIYAFQNTSPLEDDPRYIGLFAELGVRIVQLAYMFQNTIGSGCLEPHDGGLTSYGRDVVRELQAQGVAVDRRIAGRRRCPMLSRLPRAPFFSPTPPLWSSM